MLLAGMIMKINTYSANTHTYQTATKHSNVIYESNVVSCLIFFSGLYVDQFLKRVQVIYRNKYDAVMKKVLDNEKLIKLIRGDSVIYVRSSKDFKIALKKLMQGKKQSQNLESILYQHKKRFNTVRNSFLNYIKAIRSVKETIPSLLFTANFSK